MTRAAPEAAALGLVVQGVVQGVGFRPFVHRLATAERLTGWVRNSAEGVEIALYGNAAGLARFRRRLCAEAPPLARIDGIREQAVAGGPPAGFTIRESAPGDVRTAATPDAALCADCRREMLDPADRRYGYPFLNCTNCGPRFSIMHGLPYDRANTSMRRFEMCAACRAEYDDVGDRRFHAQPIACPVCGPTLWLESSGAPAPIATGVEAIAQTQARLRRGEICAVKGIGGFHLVCSAVDCGAIDRLRDRKRRPSKPFAVMVRDLATAERYCLLGEAERALLAGAAAPIVLARRRPEKELPASLAPGLDRLGIMLPYAPLHALLMARFDAPLVMTSGNARGEPQATTNERARADLAPFADVFLIHDRDIVNRVDDSVVQIADGEPQVLRRTRGYAPNPLPLPQGFPSDHPQVLALGSDIKHAFAVAKAGAVVLSQHIGDLTGVRTLADLDANLRLYRDLYALDPGLIAADPHPGYRSSEVARALAGRQGAELIEVAHHHAHAAACMAEHGLALDHAPVLALVQDGIGLGADGALWGAELLRCDYRTARRLASLKTAVLPGGDLAAREPWRNLLARLDAAFPDPSAWPAVYRHALARRPVDTLRAAMRAGVNAPVCSSAGRLFDAVAAAVGLCPDRQSYEGEAAMRLQAAAERWIARRGRPQGYRFAQASEGHLAIVDPDPIWRAIADDLGRDADPGEIAARFHAGWARIWAATVKAVAHPDQSPTVVLSGGVFQNALLASLMASDLGASGYAVLQHRDIPANDGGLALGQAVVALARHRAAGK
ncbi:MAG: carbamoyltransferase HypF [Rhodobacteraceae bacterium]|nr:carbamoyltransferase HypF [Paracoccaceae bacterium]